MSPDTCVRPVRELDAQVLPGPWAWAIQNQSRIDEHWSRAAARQPALFNGEMLICPERRFDGDRLTLGYRYCRYADFLYFRSLGFPPEAGGHVYAMAALQAGDGTYVLGVMGAHTANAGKRYFPAGTPDPQDLTPDGRLDLAAGVVRELYEETGLTERDVHFEDEWAAVVIGATIALMQPVRSPLGGDQLRDRILEWLPRAPEPELDDVLLVRSSADLVGDIGDTTAAYLRHRYSS